METAAATVIIEVLGGVLLLSFALILWKAHTRPRNHVDLSYLLVDQSSNTVTLAKFGGLLCLLASTWVFVYMAVSGHFDTGFASVYMLTWGAVKVAADVTGKMADKTGGA